MKKLLAIFSFAILAAATLPAQAGFLVDPYLSYETGTAKSPGAASESYTGIGYGSRFGYSFLGFWAGGELGLAKIESDNSSIDVQDLALAGGYEFPIMIRAYASYILSSKATFDGGSSTGTGTKIGFGYTGLPFVSINLELLTRTYTKSDIDGLGEVDTDTTDTSTVLSVSMPLDF